MANIKVVVDAACVNFYATDQEPGVYNHGAYTVHATLAAAKRQALREAIPERDEWIKCVRDIRETHLNNVMGL